MGNIKNNVLIETGEIRDYVLMQGFCLNVNGNICQGAMFYRDGVKSVRI